MLVSLPGPFTDTPLVLFRRAGYHPEPGFRGEEAYARRVASLAFPRFHLYIHVWSADGLQFNIHIDQKRPSYSGSHAHAGEYAGPALVRETERIRQILTQPVA